MRLRHWIATGATRLVLLALAVLALLACACHRPAPDPVVIVDPGPPFPRQHHWRGWAHRYGPDVVLVIVRADP